MSRFSLLASRFGVFLLLSVRSIAPSLRPLRLCGECPVVDLTASAVKALPPVRIEFGICPKTQ
jgi:hypothetical protein